MPIAVSDKMKTKKTYRLIYDTHLHSPITGNEALKRTDFFRRDLLHCP